MAECIDSKETQNGNHRSLFYKKPISRNNFKLEIDYDDSPQETRRQEFLNQQKRNRETGYNNTRGILPEDYDSENEEEEMDVDIKKAKKKFFKHRHKYYENHLMLSEWLLEVPEDFIDKWIMVPCPEGRRVLLVARKGKTKAYDRRGRKLSTFNSALPGGSSEDYKSSCSMLDCIWQPKEKKYYVLDILAWSNYPFTNCETEFRFYWLQHQLGDIKELEEKNSNKNRYPIAPLPRVFCNSNMSSVLENLPSITLDGILFFHREADYTHGRTPLVTWLKPFMLPEILGIAVPSSMSEKPNGYIDLEHYISKKKKKVTSELMETVCDELS
ncbi:snurportin-1 [Leptopilina heterotoma]|uniref:snurportin-1 n=1 Tax=Leptopilina heterotoma TaxID=63436 RepID=UPI001CAA37C9|nr:snurportin-1 [Leptopilina heterotoma]XP_043484137.1 snurportin-1 [Leptopilina heterotoma]XP_043484138.1 snurportin-1 [Leptopilina heterotoma]XP_043484139.1 snurportin-1 [Leptopilina heterotoma]